MFDAIRDARGETGTMKHQMRYGGMKFISFIILDVVCLLVAYLSAFLVYVNSISPDFLLPSQHTVVIYMVAVDLIVTFAFNTLDRVLRRRKQKELIKSALHIGISFVLLTFVLFSVKSGTSFSRIVVYLTYLFYFVLMVGAHLILRAVLRTFWGEKGNTTALLMTTDRFADEGLEELKKLRVDVKNLYLLKNINQEQIEGIPVVKTWEEAASVICWKLLDRVYIYGLDHQMVPDYLVKACREMGLRFHLVDFTYRVIEIKTIPHSDPKFGSLSFLESKRDIPFPIRRVYWITETEAGLHRGFHAHKLNCQLLYCPYGVIDIILDDGQKRTTVTLDHPGKGLILMPGLWREMVWRQSGSVLCVLASEYYDAQEYIRNYDEFIEYNKKYRGSADPLAT